MDNMLVFKMIVEEISVMNNEGISASELFTDDFIRSSKEVLVFRKRIVQFRWRSFIDTCYKKILSSHEIYLTFIIFACYREQECHENIFDIFIDVFTVITNLIYETFKKMGVKFFPLIPDIFLIFYQAELQDDFCKNGGTRKLVQYIRNHKLLRGKLNRNNLLSSDFHHRDSIAYKRYFDEKFKEEIFKGRLIEIVTYPEEVEHHEDSYDLVKEVLSIVEPSDLPTLPSYAEMISRLVAFRKKNAKEIPGAKEKPKSSVKPQALNVRLKECSSSISYSKTDYNKQNEGNIERYENIIQAVIRHNRSTSSSNEQVKDLIQKDADEILERLKNTIESLVEILEGQTSAK